MQPQPTVTTTVGGPITTPATIYVQQQPVLVTPRVYDNFQHKSSYALGITQVVIGSLCILFNAVGIGIGSFTSNSGTGIWTGIFVSISQS